MDNDFDPDEFADSLCDKKLCSLSREGKISLISEENIANSDSPWHHLLRVKHQLSGKTLPGWVACKYCQKVFFRTHSKLNKATKSRKNNGYSAATRHAKSCTTAPSTSIAHSASVRSQATLSQFVYSKKTLSVSSQVELKKAEAAFVISGELSFLALEDDGLLKLAQTLVDIGATYGKLPIENIWYGRKTIRDYIVSCQEEISNNLKATLKPFIQQNRVACTTDMWTDSQQQRSFLEMSIFWIDDFTLKHAMARCKPFVYDRKTASNIHRDLLRMMHEFGLKSTDTPITTDAGANIALALRDEIRLQCMCHRLSTVLNDAWRDTKSDHPELKAMDDAVRDVSRYVHQSSGIQEKLSHTIKKFSATRPWRGYSKVFNSFNASFMELRAILEQRGEGYRMDPINAQLLNILAIFFLQFDAVFDNLEHAVVPTVQNVLPSLYIITNEFCGSSVSDLAVISTLKRHITTGMNSKYWSSVNNLHLIATLLDPTFSSFSFISQQSERSAILGDAKKGLHF
jgi:hypothetical protein